MKHSSIIASFLIGISVILGLTSVWNDSPVVDEIPHIGAGYSYVVKGTMLFNPEHPPLVKDVAGLFMLPLNLNPAAFGMDFKSNWPTDVNGEWNFGHALIFTTGNDATAVVHAAKLPMVLFFVACAVIIFLWTRKIYGVNAALLATFLFSFSPTIIAHSRLVTTDVGSLFGILLSSYFFFRYLHEQNPKNFWIATVMFGIALLTKFSTAFLVPYLFIVALLWDWAHHTGFKTTLKTIAMFALGTVLIVGPFYQLHVRNYPPAKQKSDAQIILSTFGNRLAADPVIWASDKPVLRPYAEYALGILMIFQRNAGGNTTYFMGKVYDHGIKRYFPIVYFLKEPLPFWILLFGIVVGGFLTKKHWKKHNFIKDHFDEVGMLLWLVIYWYLSITANVDIGVRHLIPVYGFTYILLSGQLVAMYHRLRHSGYEDYYRVVVGILLAWYLIETLVAFPFYLSYFNEVAGGSSGGYRYVTDSNTDWGQDLQRLADWVKENKVNKIYLDYFGWADRGYYLGNKQRWLLGQYTSKYQFLLDNPNGGYVAVSATFYMQDHVTRNVYGWLSEKEKVAFIGNSIFVWHIKP